MFIKSPAPRIFATVYTPNIADPVGWFPLIEFKS